jgi:hypothetical protein
MQKKYKKNKIKKMKYGNKVKADNQFILGLNISDIYL